MFEERVPFEQYELLSQRVAQSYKKDGKKLPAVEIKKLLDDIVSKNIDAFLKRYSLPLTDRDNYSITSKDPYLLLTPKREGKNRNVSLRKFWFFWDYFDMEAFISDHIKQRPKNYLFDALKEFIYEGGEANGDLKEGHYVLKRMSLNAALKGHIAVIRMWVYTDTNAVGDHVLKYKAINAYDQQSPEDDKPYARSRISEGFVIRNQQNTLLLGSINYTHLDETEGESSPNHYPEIISLHTASQYSRQFVGFVLANYPDYKKPSVTQCYIERIENYEHSFEEYKTLVDHWQKERVPLQDDKIGVKKPTALELSYLKFVMNDFAHKNILIAQNSEVQEK